MPFYDFKCNACGYRFTVNVPMSQRQNVFCPECGSGELTQLFTAINILGIGGGCSSPPGSRFT